MVRRYRVRLLFDGEDITGDREWLVPADLDDGIGLASSRADLDRKLATLARAEGARPRDWHHYCLALHDWRTDERVCNWGPLTAAEDDTEAWA